MSEKAVFTQADVNALHDKNAETPVDLAAMVASGMNDMVANGEDPATFSEPEEEFKTEQEGEQEGEVDEVLEQAIAKGFDPDYEGEDAKTAEEFIAYGEALEEKKATDRKARQLDDRLERLEVERSILAESDAANLRQRMQDLTSMHKDAVEEADYGQVTAIQKQLDETRLQLQRVNKLTEKVQPPSKQTASVDEDAQDLINDFEAKNKWIQDGDDKDTQYAQFVFNRSLGQSQLEGQSERVEEAIDAVKDAIPHRFKSVNKARNKAAENSKGKGRSPKASQVTERDLSREELNAYKAFKRSGVYNTPGEYYKEMVEGVKA